MSSTIILPRILETGAGALAKTADILAALGCRKPCIISDKIMVKLGYVGQLTRQLDDRGLSFGIFDDTMPEPTDASIAAAVTQVKTGDFDCLIALGGGSAIDSAKAIGILAIHGGQMDDYKVPAIVDRPGLPVIAIPTTAGTGSEATRVCVITNATNEEKMLCMGPALMPHAAIIDFQLSLSVPPRTTADTGIDALTHAIEAYVSQKANLFSDQQAIAAIKLIAPNLRTVYHQPDNAQAREAMMLGATLAGIAFSNASVALVHGMSRPIGAHFHVPHGLSNAMLLPLISEYSLAAAPQRYADCARAMGIAAEQDSDHNANQRLIAELQAINAALEVPSLAEFGVEKADYLRLLPLMAEQALASGSPGNNPRKPGIDEIIRLYQALWR